MGDIIQPTVGTNRTEAPEIQVYTPKVRVKAPIVESKTKEEPTSSDQTQEPAPDHA